MKKKFLISTISAFLLTLFFLAAILSGCKTTEDFTFIKDTLYINDTTTVKDTVYINDTTIINDTVIVNDTTIINDTVYIIVHLAGTTWRLASIYDAQYDTLVLYGQEDFVYCTPSFYPGDCYSIDFDTDSTAKGRSVDNTIYLYLYKNNIASYYMTQIGETGKAGYFCTAFSRIRKYVLSLNTLILDTSNEEYQLTLKKEK